MREIQPVTCRTAGGAEHSGSSASAAHHTCLPEPAQDLAHESFDESFDETEVADGDADDGEQGVGV